MIIFYIPTEYKKYGLGSYGTSAMDTGKQVFTGVHTHLKRDERIGLKI